MQVLWKKPNSTLKEMAESMKSHKWSDTTIRTLITRLMEKGAISADKSIANNFKYFPILMENACKKREANGFIFIVECTKLRIEMLLPIVYNGYCKAASVI